MSPVLSAARLGISSSRLLKVGLLGASRIAPGAILEDRLDLPGTEVAAIAAREFERAKAYAVEFGIPRVEPSYTALLVRA